MGKVVLLQAAKRLSTQFGYSSIQLREAIPYIREFQDKVMVVKVGGSILNDDDGDLTAQRTFLEDVIFMAQIGIRAVLVHGGSYQLSRRMREEGLSPAVRQGERYTDAPTLSLAVEVFNRINSEIVEAIKALGGRAIGFRAGKDCLIYAERKHKDPNNFVGKVTKVDADRLRALKKGYIPVLTCIGFGEGQLFNVNADEVASRVALALRAEKVILLTNVDGVKDEKGSLISTLTQSRAKRLISSGIVDAGMVPKVRVCLEALEAGVTKAHIINGATEGSLLCEVLSESGVGTELVKAKARRVRASG